MRILEKYLEKHEIRTANIEQLINEQNESLLKDVEASLVPDKMITDYIDNAMIEQKKHMYEVVNTMRNDMTKLIKEAVSTVKNQVKTKVTKKK